MQESDEARSIERASPRPEPGACELFRFRGVSADPVTAYLLLAKLTRGRLGDLLKQRKSRDVDEAGYATDELDAAVSLTFVLSDESWTVADRIDLLIAFLRFLADEEERGKEVADMVAAYGAGVLELPYSAYVRLWLNLPRVQKQRAMAVAEGVAMAQGGGSIDRSFFESVLPTREDAEQAEFEVNASRKHAKILAKHGYK